MIRVHLFSGENVDFYTFSKEDYAGLVNSMLIMDNINTFHVGLTIFNFDKIDYIEWLELAEDPDESI